MPLVEPVTTATFPASSGIRACAESGVSAFMRNIQASPYLENPNLVEIKAVDVNRQRANEFVLDFFIKRAQPETKGKGTAPAA